MKLKIITVGKLKEDYLKKGIEFYKKGISKKIQLELIEVTDEKAPENMSQKEEEKIKEIEGKKILSHIKENTYVVALAIEGKAIDMKSFLEKKKNDQLFEIAFVIGGSLGLSKEVLTRSDYKISFSKMTFPHQLMKLILMEQLEKSI